jgi:3-hydroxyacyl-CoA dehydrogenase
VQARRDLESCTSYLDVDEIAASTSVRRHFFSPANVVMLLEVVRGANTDDDVLATVMALAKTIKNVAVVTVVTFGFIGNRMLRQRQTEAAELLLAGASPEQIDKVYTDF